MTDLDNAAELSKLAHLRDRGVLTQSEYQAEENKILQQSVAAPSSDAELAASQSETIDFAALASEARQPIPPPSHAPADQLPRRRRRMAERTHFTGVLALLCAIVFWPAGIILGYQARREARQTGDGDDRLALVALVIGYIAAVLTIIVVIVTASK